MTDHDIAAAQAHAAHLALNDRSADRLALLAEIDRLRGLVTALWQGGEAMMAADEARLRAQRERCSRLVERVHAAEDDASREHDRAERFQYRIVTALAALVGSEP